VVQADTTSLSQFADGSFDLVLCSAGLIYLHVDVALRKWCRLLEPGGLIGFSAMRAGFPVPARLFREHARLDAEVIYAFGRTPGGQ
jgi:ubiquinone/menaquinone biosynthesis C-methylase UbiE